MYSRVAFPAASQRQSQGDTGDNMRSLFACLLLASASDALLNCSFFVDGAAGSDDFSGNSSFPFQSLSRAFIAQDACDELYVTTQSHLLHVSTPISIRSALLTRVWVSSSDCAAPTSLFALNGLIHAGDTPNLSISLNCVSIFNSSAPVIHIHRVSSLAIDFANFDDISSSAIVMNSSQPSTISITNSVFTKCSTSGHGGALFLNNSFATMAIANSTFSSNSASNRGGAAFLAGYDVSITSSTFLDNSALVYGGAVYVRAASSSRVSDCAFSNNAATAGALFMDDDKDGVALLLGSTFTNNVARGPGVGAGGALGLASRQGFVFNSTFYNNFAEKGGSAFVIFKGSWTLRLLTILNGAVGDSFVGAIILQNCQVVAANLIFRNNTSSRGSASSSGFVLAGATLLLSNSSFVASSSHAINCVGGAALVTSCSFSSGSDSAISVGEGCIVQVEGSRFLSNRAFVGAALTLKGGSVNVTDCLFYNNSAATGGAIFVGFGLAESFLSVRNSSFLSNVALNPNQGGGAIVTQSSHVIIDECTFDSNVCGGNGAAVAALISTTAYSRTLFINSIGAALFIQNGVSDITACAFENNTATLLSSSCLTTLTANVSITASAFRWNRALIAPQSFGGTLSLSGSTIAMRSCASIRICLAYSIRHFFEQLCVDSGGCRGENRRKSHR